jgi:hypothetical protein
MPLINPQEMTEANLAAKLANGSMSRGPVTPEGKAHSAASNLRHGFYCQAQNGALTALGEDPQEYAELMNSLEDNFAESLESELVQRIGRVLWRMKRAERMQDGLALKRLEAAKEIHEITTLPQRERAHESLAVYECLATAMARRGNGPTTAEIQPFVEGVGDDPSEPMQEFLPLLESLNKLADGPERQAARRNARAQLHELTEAYRKICQKLTQQLNEMASPENLAAQIAPQDEQSMLMQRMEDSSLRKLWRLTNMLVKVRNGALAHKDVKNEGRSDYVHENTGNMDKMSCDETGFLQENAPITR